MSNGTTLSTATRWRNRIFHGADNPTPQQRHDYFWWGKHDPDAEWKAATLISLVAVWLCVAVAVTTIL